MTIYTITAVMTFLAVVGWLIAFIQMERAEGYKRKYKMEKKKNREDLAAFAGVQLLNKVADRVLDKGDK